MRLDLAAAGAAPSGECRSPLRTEDIRSLLVFEGIRTEAPADGYLEVYIGLPEGTEPNFESPYYAGNVDFFGADASCT